ncbi:MAG: serine/threonine protein kinase, partial [Planctomycetes bacterium]|nr:serine/threonine protein kinase [Planctomycetota bacterium]
MNAPHPLVGRRIGDYEVLSELGQGGMGLVFHGRHVQLGQAVAIKSLHTGLTSNPSARERFVREAQALARLNHPNIIALLNFINDDSGCYIIMEYAEGEDLEAKVQRMGLVPPAECLPWFVQACRALSYAHQQGVIHRDIKPSNIFIHPSGQTKLLDFGTAKLIDGKRLTQQGMTLGTVIYMSREQVLGETLDARSDVYSLGVTLYETVTGQLPFNDDNERQLVVKIAKEEPVPPRQHCAALDPKLEAVILKALAKDREQRYQTAAEFEAALTELMAGVQTLTAAPPAMLAEVRAAVAAYDGEAKARKGLLESPAFLVGLVCLLLAVAGGVPLALLSEGSLRVAGASVGGVLGLLGLVLVVLGLGSRGGGAPAKPKPAP